MDLFVMSVLTLGLSYYYINRKIPEKIFRS